VWRKATETAFPPEAVTQEAGAEHIVEKHFLALTVLTEAAVER